MIAKRWIFLDYFRVAAMFLVMWPHLTELINPQWQVLAGVQWLINRPLHIIQNFGALGVCYFLLISGFLLNKSTEGPVQFAAILSVNLGLGCVTPPCALLLYLAGSLGNAQINQMLKPCMYYIFFGWIPVLILTTYIPDISLFLPRLILGIR